MNDSTDAQAPARPKRPLWRRILRWTLRVAVALIVLAVVVWSVWNYLAARALRAEIEKVRAAGEPVTFEELIARRPKPAPGEDAAPYYRAALALISADDREQVDRICDLLDTLEKVIDDGTPVPGKLLTDAQRAVAEYQLAFDLVDKGSARPGCDYDLQIQYGVSSVSGMSGARQMAKTLSVRTRLLALRGEGDDSVASLVSALRLARMMDREPVLLCRLLKISLVALAIEDVAVVLESGSPAGQALARLEAELAAAEAGTDLRRAWIAERVYALQTIRSAYSCGGWPGQASPPAGDGWPTRSLRSPFLNTLAVSMLWNYSELISAARAGWPGVLDGTRAGADRQGRSVFARFSAPLSPAIDRAIVMAGRGLGVLRSAGTAVMVEHFRREKGRLPASLAELAAETGKKLPLDPFTGKDLIYRPAEGEYRVFSVDDDRKENPGKPLNSGDDSDWGVRVRLPRPPAR